MQRALRLFFAALPLCAGPQQSSLSSAETTIWFEPATKFTESTPLGTVGSCDDVRGVNEERIVFE